MKLSIVLFIIGLAIGTSYAAVAPPPPDCRCPPMSDIINYLKNPTLPDGTRVLDCLDKLISEVRETNLPVPPIIRDCLNQIGDNLNQILAFTWDVPFCDKFDNWLQITLPIITNFVTCVCNIFNAIINFGTDDPKLSDLFCRILKCLLQIISTIFYYLICLIISAIRECYQNNIPDDLINILIQYAQLLVNLVNCICKLRQSPRWYACVKVDVDNVTNKLCCLINELRSFNNGQINDVLRQTTCLPCLIQVNA